MRPIDADKIEYFNDDYIARRREKSMANKPVIGYQVCPHCGGKVPVIWDGNRKETCMYCKKRFQLKRQKLKNTMRVKRPPEGEEDTNA